MRATRRRGASPALARSLCVGVRLRGIGAEDEEGRVESEELSRDRLDGAVGTGSPYDALVAASLGDVEAVSTLRSLAAHGDGRAREALLQLLGDVPPLVRAEACRAVEALSEHRAVGPLLDLLTDPEEHVRAAAQSALLALCAKAPEPLLERVGWECAERQVEICRLLGRIRDPRAADALVPLVDTPDPGVRDAAWRALEAIFLAVEAQPAAPVCKTCFARFVRRRKICAGTWAVDWYVCPICERSRDALVGAEYIAACLDRNMRDEFALADGVLRVNWLRRETLGEFDWAEIVRASDYEVERFCLQLGNDPDPARRRRYKNMRCFLAERCRLSEQTIRILRRTFVRVENPRPPGLGAHRLRLRFRKWQDVIWHEWRNSADPTYARQLLELVADEPADWRANVLVTALGSSYGLAAGALLYTVGRMVEAFAAAEIVHAVGAVPWGLVIFGATALAGLAALIGSLCIRRRLTWGILLSALERLPWGLHNAFLLGMYLFPPLAVVIGVIVGLAAEVQAGLVAALFSLLFAVPFGLLIIGPVLTVSGLTRDARPRGDESLLRACFWWQGRPYPSEVEEALWIAHQPPWGDYLRDLARRKQSPPPLALLLRALRSDDWLESFLARHTLASLGGQVAESLQALARNPSSDLRDTAAWLLRCIAGETQRNFARRYRNVLCRYHLVQFAPHKLRLSRLLPVTYYGCRVCRQSREFLECPGGAVAVLNRELVRDWVIRDGVLRVNWLAFRKPFDFSSVEIRLADDREVVRFCETIRSDADEPRRRGYGRMRCTVWKRAKLAEDTMRILRETFGEVEAGERTRDIARRGIRNGTGRLPSSSDLFRGGDS